MRLATHRPCTAVVILATVLFATAFADAATQAYKQTNLVSDGSAPAAFTDPNLKNPWGVAIGPGPFWVANQMTGTATTYDGSGMPAGITVTVPAAPGATGDKGPTGQVFNSTADFGGSLFIFSGLDGTITTWQPSNDTTAVIASNQSDRAVYTGLALGNSGGNNFLFAANGRAGTVDVFDKSFALTTPSGGTFVDPNLESGLVPFNVQNVNGKLYVTYTQPDELAPTATILGVVDEFGTDGSFVRRVATGGPLNGPWGVVKAPADFGEFSNALIIGNDGNGHLNAFDETTGNFLGEFKDANGNPIVNEELWGLTFGNGAGAGDANKLFFAAGINDEAGGLFGSIEPATSAAIPLPNFLAITPVVLVFAGLCARRMAMA